MNDIFIDGPAACILYSPYYTNIKVGNYIKYNSDHTLTIHSKKAWLSDFLRINTKITNEVYFCVYESLVIDGLGYRKILQCFDIDQIKKYRLLM